MKKINLKGVSETLSEREMKCTMGGSQGGGSGMDQRLLWEDMDGGALTGDCYNLVPCDATNDCMGRVCGEVCTQKSTGRIGKCMRWLCHGSFFPTTYGTVCGVGFI